MLQPGSRRSVPLLWAALLLLAAGLVAGQQNASVTVRCSVQITQPDTLRTVIDCTSQGSTAGFYVVVQSATALSNNVSYTLNGEAQTLGDSSFQEDGSQLLSNPTSFPALVALGFSSQNITSGNSSVRQAGTTLSITANVSGVVLPSQPLGTDPSASPQMFSGLRVSGVEALVIRDSVFDAITATDAANQIFAAVVYADGDLDNSIHPAITVTNSTFSSFGGSVGAGALTFQQLSSQSYGAVSITDTAFTANTATGQGPGMYAQLCPSGVTCTANLTITNCNFTSNDSTGGYGGAMYLEAGAVQVRNSTFAKNSAGLSGGALFFTSATANSSLDVSDSVFISNTAGTCTSSSCSLNNEGGAAMAVITSQLSSSGQSGPRWQGSTVLTVRDSTFIDNQNAKAFLAGAVLFGRDRTQTWDLAQTFQSGSATLSTGLFQNVSFINNIAPQPTPTTNSQGGAIYDRASQGLTINNCTFTNNTAGSGAAIYSLWATYLNITGGTIVQQCKTLYAFGGAVAMSDLGRSLTIKDATFLENTCHDSTASPTSAGAAVWMERQLVQNPNVTFNYTASISDTQFISNTCQQGGALYISQVEHTIGPNVVFDGNTANAKDEAGGAIVLSGLSDPQYLAAAQSSNITGTVFRNNYADSQGGALYINGIWQPHITNSLFHNNSVTTTALLSDLGYSGGAVYVSQLVLTPLVINATNFTNNAAFQGGAVTVLQSDVQINSCLFDGNTASGEGGAMRYLTADPGHQVNLTAVSFTFNNASTAGALQISQAGAIISGCHFADNTASASGGAISFESCAPAANTTLGLYTPAVGIDSAVVADNQTAYVLNSVFERNVADSTGGGAVYATSSRVVFVRSSFSSSSTITQGGAVYATSSLINDYQGNFTNNIASQGGAFYTESCNVTLNSTQLQGNNATRGGAVFVGLAPVDLQHPGLVAAELNNCTATGNVAASGLVLDAGYGGCLSADGSNITIRAGVWTSNSAALGGGAIDARGNSTLVMQDVGTMRLNSANGGTGGAVNINGMASALIINTDMQDNVALSDGGSLWSGGTYCLLLVGSTLSSSNTSTGSGGGAYVSLPGTQGCTTALVSPHLAQLSPAGVAALPEALQVQHQGSGRRLLQQSTLPNSTTLNLLVVGSAFTSGRAVNGGGLALQLAPGGAAVLDQATITGCSGTPAGTCSVTGRTGTTTSDGGGLYMTMLSTQSSFTCSVVKQTSAVDITSSTLAYNNATLGNGGAAAVSSDDASLVLQATFSNSTITNNTASNGGALSAQGPGAFLSVLAGSRITANTATPTPNATLGSSGGCVYAASCQGLLLGNATQLSQCQALPGAGGRVTVNGVSVTTSGRSVGGAVSADGCQAVVVDGTTITGNSAGAGGGMAAKDTAALLLLNATLVSNTATAVTSTSATTTAIDALGGVGGSLWVSGSTATLVRGSSLSSNTASLFGGAVAAITDCSGNGTGSTIQVPAALVDYPVLNSLASRAANGCYAMSVQSSFVSDNKALVPGTSASGAGGALFGISNSSILMNACADIQSPTAGVVLRSTDLGALSSNLAAVAACPRNNNVAGGYGHIIATVPFRLSINQTGTVQQVDPQADVPLVWFTADNALVMPSTSPVTPAIITLRVLDAAGQDVQDQYLSNLFTITASSTADADMLDLFGPKAATYNSTSGDFRIDGLALRAKVGNNYTFAFTLSSTLSGGGQVSPLQQIVIVPDCGDGEKYANDQRTACISCNGSYFGFSKQGMPAPDCLPCPTTGQCSGGAVLVPIAGQWHSSPNSTEMHNCMNQQACARDDQKVQTLQACQSAWYAFKKLVRFDMSQSQIDAVAVAVLQSYNCTLFDVDTLIPLNPANYLDLLCGDGYGGNLCGVCVKNSNGKQTALKSNNQCSECSPDWVVYLITALLFVVNLFIIMVQVFAALGEQMLSSTVQFADIFGAIINHVQYLIVVLKLQFQWPNAINDFHQAISATVSFANEAIKFASITCLSDGSPEAQATYQMGASLTIPLILIATAVFIWILCYYLRLYVLYPRQDSADRLEFGRSRLDDPVAGQSLGPNQVMVDIREEEYEGEHAEADGQPEAPGKDNSFTQLSGPAGHLGASHRSAAPGPSNHHGSGRSNYHGSGRTQPRSGHWPAADGASHISAGWADAFRSATQRSVASMPAADAEDDAPPPDANQMMQDGGPSLRRNQTDLRRWQLPGAEKAPEDALWFDTAAEERARQQRMEENQKKLTLVAKFRLLDKYMPLWQQLVAVIIIACFVVYQGWASAALSPFACQILDDGTVDPRFPSQVAYYADFQLATAPNGYWNLNMNQACYQGIHRTKWTPIGAVMSVVIGLGIPCLMFLPVFFNRKALTNADTQLRWGWLYIRFYYGRLPYWAAVQILELLVFIIVQTFTGGLNSVVEQAVLLQLTLILILVINTCLWPLVHPLLILTSFLSYAILIFTLGLAIIIGDGSMWTLTDPQANAVGAIIILVNVLFVVLLLFLFYTHLRDVIHEGFLTTTAETRKVVGKMWQRSIVATRNLRSMKTYAGVRSILSKSKNNRAGG